MNLPWKTNERRHGWRCQRVPAVYYQSGVCCGCRRSWASLCSCCSRTLCFRDEKRRHSNQLFNGVIGPHRCSWLNNTYKVKKKRKHGLKLTSFHVSNSASKSLRSRSTPGSCSWLALIGQIGILNDKVQTCDVAVFLLHRTLTVPPHSLPQRAGPRGPKPLASPSAVPPAASSTSTLSDTYADRDAELPAEVGLLSHSLCTCKAAQSTEFVHSVHILSSREAFGSGAPWNDSTRCKRRRHTDAAC